MKAIWSRIQSASESEIGCALTVIIRLLLARGFILLMLRAMSRIVLIPNSMLVRAPWGIQQVSVIQLRWLALISSGIAVGTFIAYAKVTQSTAIRRGLRTWLHAISVGMPLAALLLLLWSFGLADPQIFGSMLEATSLWLLLLLAALLSGMIVVLNSRSSRNSIESDSHQCGRSVWLQRIVSAGAFMSAALALVKPTLSQHRAEVAVISLVAALLVFVLRDWLTQLIADFFGSRSDFADRTSSLASALRRFFVEIPDSSFHRTDLAVLVGIVTLGSYLFWLGSPPQYLYPHDLFIYYDAAWRIVCGQRPHADYVTAIGPLPQTLYALGWWMAPQKGNSLAYGHAIFGLLMSLWTWRISRNRLSAAMTILFVIFIAANSTALTCLGNVPFQSTFSMAPNRYGHSMLCVFTLIIFVRAAVEEDRWRVWELISAGVLLAGMLFCKISFFVVGAGLVPVALLGRGIDFRDLMSITGGFLLGCLPWLALCGFDLAALYRDYSTSFAVNRGGLIASVLEKLTGLTGQVVLGATAIACVLAVIRRFSGRKVVHIGVVTGLLFTAGVVIREGDGQPAYVSPLWIAGVFCISECLQRIGGRQWGNVLIAASCLWGIRDQIACDLASVISPAIPVSPSVIADRLATRGFQEMAFHPVAGLDGLKVNDVLYVNQIEEGRQFVLKEVGSNGRLVYFGFSTPFQSICRLQPPNKGVLWWHDKRTFDSDHHPPAETVFSNATHVLILKPRTYERMETRDVLLQLYSQELSSQFRMTAESRSFLLWSKKD